MDKPLFSVIIPTYNRSGELTQLIKQLDLQSWQDFEIIVVDDGSTDDTEKCVREISSRKVRYFKIENGERARARNFGSLQARGRYVNFFDSDDTVERDRLEVVARSLENKDIDVLFTPYDFKTPGGHIIGTCQRPYQSFHKDLLFNNFLATGAVFLKREIALQNPFNETRDLITAEDWELWLRVYGQYPFTELPVKTFSITQHDMRSLNTISPDRVEKRERCFISLIMSDHPLKRKASAAEISLFIGDRFTFIALTMAGNGRRRQALSYLLKSCTTYPWIWKRRRFWGILKTLFTK